MLGLILAAMNGDEEVELPIEIGAAARPKKFLISIGVMAKALDLSDQQNVHVMLDCLLGDKATSRVELLAHGRLIDLITFIKSEEGKDIDSVGDSAESVNEVPNF